MPANGRWDLIRRLKVNRLRIVEGVETANRGLLKVTGPFVKAVSSRDSTDAHLAV